MATEQGPQEAILKELSKHEPTFLGCHRAWHFYPHLLPPQYPSLPTMGSRCISNITVDLVVQVLPVVEIYTQG